MNDLLQRYGKWALVTGASSGIGEEFCRFLALQKFNLVIIARRGNRLQILKDDLERQYSIIVKPVVTDLSTDYFMADIIKITDSLNVSLLINNAGFALVGEFLDNSLHDELGMFYVNCRAPIVLAHHFGTKMAQSGRGGIINISSVTAFLTMPKRTNYSAAKAHNLLFSQGLWYELKNKGVDVLAVCPGATQTEFAQISGIRNSGMLPQKVVISALNKLGKKPMLIVGANNKLVVFLTRFIPYATLIKIGAIIINKLSIR